MNESVHDFKRQIYLFMEKKSDEVMFKGTLWMYFTNMNIRAELCGGNKKCTKPVFELNGVLILAQKMCSDLHVNNFRPVQGLTSIEKSIWSAWLFSQYPPQSPT